MKLCKYIVSIMLMLIPLILSAGDWYESSILSPIPFMGNNGEIFKLADGSIWEVKYEYRYMYQYYPQVMVFPSQGKMVIDGKKLNVQLIGYTSGTSKSPQKSADTVVIESRVDGDFEGWEGDTIIKLTNGQIWEQTEYYYRYRYSYMPSVLIIKTGSTYKMQVEGIDRSVRVVRLK